MSRFRVLQFNMQFGQSWDEKNPDGAPVDLGRTIDEIRSHSPDIFLLQEVEHAAHPETRACFSANYFRLQQEFCAYDSYFSLPREDSRELPFGIGLAIFSRTALFGRMRLDMPSPPVRFSFNGEEKTPTDRLLIGARTEVLGRELQLYNTHLLAFFMLNTSSAQHGEQRATVEGLLRASSLPTILTGDFNVRNHQSLVRQFGDAGYATVQDHEITWRRRPYVLDHIFHSAELRCVHHQVAPTLASDHHVLLADFEWI